MYRKFIASFLLLLVAACAGQQKPTPTLTVPDKLKARANESLVMIVPAKGVQIYECREKRIKSAPMNGHSSLLRRICLIQAERRLADTMQVHIGNRPMAVRSRVL